MLQQVVADPDFLPGCWLSEGMEAADAVALLMTPAARGSGFLVSPWLLLTNHHVLPDVEHAAGTAALFRFVTDDRNRILDPHTLRLAPERCFVTSPVEQLDYTLVAVAALDDGRAPGAEFGAIPLCGGSRAVRAGQPVNIIQHPAGRPREIAVRNNRLIGVDLRYLSYETDSECGSSGSPVLNDRWELVGLHSRCDLGDDEGQPAPSPPRMVNMGIRVSAVVADLEARAGEHGPDVTALITAALALREHPSG